MEGEGAQGGVALSPAGVASVVGAVAAVMARPSSTGAMIWSVRPRMQLCGRQLLKPPAWPILRRPLLHALSRVSVSDSNKPHVLAEGGTRVLDACATVLGWGTPGSPVDGGAGR